MPEEIRRFWRPGSPVSDRNLTTGLIRRWQGSGTIPWSILQNPFADAAEGNTLLQHASRFFWSAVAE
jgi:hypothetical protein